MEWPNAVIKLPTQAECDVLIDFLIGHDFPAKLARITCRGEDFCVDLNIPGDRQTITEFEGYYRSKEDETWEYDWWPDDPELYLCTVEDFMAYMGFHIAKTEVDPAAWEGLL